MSRFVGGYPLPHISAPQSQNNLKSLMAKEVAAIEAYPDLQDKDVKRQPWLILQPQRHRLLQILTDICSIDPRAIPVVMRFLALLPPGYVLLYLPSARRGRPNHLRSMYIFLLQRYRLPSGISQMPLSIQKTFARQRCNPAPHVGIV